MAKYWKWGFAVIAVIWAVCLGILFGNIWIEANQETTEPSAVNTAKTNAEETPPSVSQSGSSQSDGSQSPNGQSQISEETFQLMEGYWTVAIFGVDSRDGILDKDTRSDMEMVCNINMETGEIRLVSIYRDTYVKINDKGQYHKINEAYFQGGPEQAVKTLNDNMDLVIDDYAAFNWKAVVDAINILGGIDVDISKEEFQVINGFITETVNSTGVGSHQLKHDGLNHLDGVQAVSYARLRKMDTDFKRTERQRLVAELVLKKARQAGTGTLIQVVSAVLPQISTSIGITDLLPMAKSISRFHLTEASGFPFELKDCMIGKKDCVIPVTLESNVTQLHRFLFDKENYIPSDHVKEISREIERQTKGKKSR